MGLGGTSRFSHGGKDTPLAFGETLLLPASAGPCTIVPGRPVDGPHLRDPVTAARR